MTQESITNALELIDLGVPQEKIIELGHYYLRLDLLLLHQFITQGVPPQDINYERLESIARNDATTADVASEWARKYITGQSINYATLTKDEA